MRPTAGLYPLLILQLIQMRKHERSSVRLDQKFGLHLHGYEKSKQNSHAGTKTTRVSMSRPDIGVACSIESCVKAPMPSNSELSGKHRHNEWNQLPCCGSFFPDTPRLPLLRYC